MVHFSLTDKVLSTINDAMDSLFVASESPSRPSPADGVDDNALSKEAKSLSTSLMRINHTGEVCAQALYRGQAWFCRDKATLDFLLHAADEEYDHLYWCNERLKALGAKPSMWNPLFYTLSFKLGVFSSALGKGYNLGFLEETENQVHAHLEEHLERISPKDRKSIAILTVMQEDEKKHADGAKQRGARELPLWVAYGMRLMAKSMKVLVSKG